MPESGPAERLAAALTKMLRGQGEATIKTWLDQLGNGRGDLLLLKAPTSTSSAIIEIGYQSGNFALLL